MRAGEVQCAGRRIHRRKIETMRSAAELFGIDVSRAAWDYSRKSAAERGNKNDDDRILGTEEEFDREINGTSEFA